MIGVFDSGSGGLTVLKALRERLPSCDSVYFGDLAHAPYGSRSPKELSALTVGALSYLRAQGATSFVSACNSVSATLALSILDALDLPAQSLIEMVGPTVAALRTSSARLLVCATEATIASGIYQNAFAMVGKTVRALAVPGLALAIEEAAPEAAKDELIRAVFANTPLAEIDGIVLACTHYPLALTNFRRVLGARLAIYDPAEAVAERAERLLWPREAGNGALRFVVSRDSAPFRALVARLFPGAPAVELRS